MEAIIIIFLLNSFIKDTIYPKTFYYLGPFSVGAGEGIIGIIEYKENFVPDTQKEYPTELVQGGRVKWKKVDAEKGKVKIDYENVWWDTLQKVYGVAGRYHGTYVWSKFDSEEEGIALAKIIGVGSFILNEKRYPAGIYFQGADFLETPVIIKKGENTLFLSVGRNEFDVKFIPIDQMFSIIRIEATIPDIILNERLETYGAISLVNNTQEKMHVKIKTGGTEYLKLYEKEETFHPLCVNKVKIKITTTKPIEEKKDIWLPIKIYHKNNEVYSDSIKLEVKTKDEAYRITFLSKMDNSVQYFAIREPKDFDKNKKYALILSLHGAGVDPFGGLIPAYEQKDWAFIVTPTNRRPFGFNWQDWGAIDALEVLEYVVKNFPIDTNRIYLTGHSMGGHGVWNIGLKWPDLFAALGPSASWATSKIYVPHTFQKSEFFAHPSLIEIKDMCLHEHNLFAYLKNVKNLPVFIIHGGRDNNVPTIQGRLFYRYLYGLENVEYMEVEGKEHWWDDETLEGGVACVDHPRLMEFFKSHTRNPFPKEIYYKTPNIKYNKCYWINLEEQEKLFKDSEIEAKIYNDTIFINTKNVSAITVDPLPEMPKYIKIDEQIVKIKPQKKIQLYKDKDIWKIGEKKIKGIYKTKELHGPIKQAYFSPFIIVYGTQADHQTNKIIYENAKFHLWKWWQRANSSVEMISDIEMIKREDEIIKNYNIILFGGPNSNAFTKKINEHLPIYIKDGFVYLGKNKINKKGVAVQLIYPNPLNNKKFIVIYGGTDREGEKISEFFPVILAKAEVPDFIIYDKEVRKFGISEVLAIGFFNKEWELDESLYYTNF